MKIFTKLVLNYFNSGYTMADVSKILNVSYKRVESIKRYYKVNVNKASQSKADYNFLSIIDNDIKAYILGFFIADGCISDEGRVSFSILKEDEYILYRIKDCFKVNNITHKNNQSGVKFRKEQSTYRFTSKPLLDILKNKYNIHPRKTYNLSFTFPFENIPNKYHGSFIRGL